MEFMRNKFDNEEPTEKMSLGISPNKEDFELYCEKDLGVIKYLLIFIFSNNRQQLWQSLTMAE